MSKSIKYYNNGCVLMSRGGGGVQDAGVHVSW